MDSPDKAFFEHLGTRRDRAELFQATRSTAGPWDANHQHGGPPAALLGRACERLDSSTGATMTVSRFSINTVQLES